MLALISILLFVVVDSQRIYFTYANEVMELKTGLDDSETEITLTVKHSDLTVESSFNFPVSEVKEAETNVIQSRVYTITDFRSSKSPFLGTVKSGGTVIAYMFIILNSSSFSNFTARNTGNAFKSIDEQVRNSLSPVKLKLLMDHLYLYMSARGDDKEGFSLLSVGPGDSFTYEFYSALGNVIATKIFTFDRNYSNKEYLKKVFIGVKDWSQDQIRHYLLGNINASDILKLLKVLEESKKGKTVEEVSKFADQLINKADTINEDFKSIPDNLSPEEKDRVTKCLFITESLGIAKATKISESPP